MKIVNASFIMSAPNAQTALPPSFNEIAFLGRSNVGKSSLINAITNKKGLAKSSSTPGKTRAINFFELEIKDNEERRKAMLIDLPGFGYAKVSKQEQEMWAQKLHEFVLGRTSIKLFLVLKDSRHHDLQIDAEIVEYLKAIKRDDFKVITVLTKIDKLNKTELMRAKRANANAIAVSATSKDGIEQLQEEIYKALFEVKA